MSVDPPLAADSRQPDSIGYFAAVTTAWVALVFCLVVVALLAVNAVQAKAHQPLAPAQIELLRAQLGTDPKNEALRAQIRGLDRDLRTGYFVGRARAIQGTYLLALGIAAFLASSHLAASFRARLPRPNSEATGRSWTDAALSLRAIVALALIMSGFLLTMLMIARHDASAEYIRAAKAMSSPKAGVPVAGVPDAPPGFTPLAAVRPPAGAPGVAPPPPLLGPVRRPGGGAPVPPPAAAKPTGPAPTPTKPAPTASGPGAHPSPTRPPAGGAPEGWPMFRGSAGGWTQAADFPVQWDAGSGDGIAWKTDIHLPGHNSPIFCGGRIFLTGADETHREVYCVDATTGKVLWTQPFGAQPGAGLKPPKVTKETGYAAPTMATDGKRVFAIFANGDVGAWDLDGKPQWAKALGAPKNAYGYAASLALYADRLIIQFDQGSEASDNVSALIALDTGTGKPVWRTPRPVRNSWSSPIVVGTGDGAQIITIADPFVIAYAPETGKELWRAGGLRGDGGPSPCYADGLVYACTDQAGLFAIRASSGNGGKVGEVV